LRALKTNGLVAIKDMSEKEQRRVWDWSKEVIRQYRKTLERNPANIRSVDELPFLKEEIKLAIELSLPLYAQKNIHSMVKNLKSIYKELGFLQSIDSKDKKNWEISLFGWIKLPPNKIAICLKSMKDTWRWLFRKKRVCLRKSTILLIGWGCSDKSSDQRQSEDYRPGLGMWGVRAEEMFRLLSPLIALSFDGDSIHFVHLLDLSWYLPAYEWWQPSTKALPESISVRTYLMR